MVSSNDDYSDLADPMPVDVYGPTKGAGTRRPTAPPAGRKSLGGTIGWCLVILSLANASIAVAAGVLMGEPMVAAYGLGVFSIIGGALIVRAAIIERG